ncbi:MAG: PACE efflux transporter [Hydrogenophaga sp.]|uniref:PACE efflux transporter n=1 Tax=Hydrogenophaga sp. TaxID=1904254 RepID=UPI002AB846A1|nr:PACE efflux transporter [Hydrogenophaga sp.]MDZ4103551.1 PACE efflux transporter [Hydrogenophaga sp.]
MQGGLRKIVYISLYELIAIVIASTGLAAGAGASLERAGAIAVASSVIAVVWNLVYNTLFERWEARQSVRGRSVRRRMAHAIGFELGFLVMLVPLFAWWFGIGLQHALVLEIGLALFFLVYTFAFNWAFDKTFGLPAAAQ